MLKQISFNQRKWFRLAGRMLLGGILYLILLYSSLFLHAWERARFTVVYSRVFKLHLAVEEWAFINNKGSNDPIATMTELSPYFLGTRESVVGERLELPLRLGDPTVAVLPCRLLNYPVGTRILRSKSLNAVHRPGAVQEVFTDPKLLPYNREPALRFVPFVWKFMEGKVRQ